MQSVRISIVLGVLAASLLVFIVWVERGTLTSGELEQRKGTAIPALVRDRISKLEIQRAGSMVVVERETIDDDAEEATETWQVRVPFRAKADQDAIDTLLGELEFLDARRRIEGISEADRKRFGFDSPRFRLWFTVGGSRIPVVVGNESPRGDGVYVRAADPDIAFVASKELVQTLSHDAAHYHTKEMHDGAMMLTALAVSVRDERGERSARKLADGSWQLQPPAAGMASQPTVSAIVEAFDGLRAKRFVEQSAKELGRYGLDTPRVDITLRSKATSDTAGDPSADKAKSRSTGQEEVVRLRVGRSCPDHPGESYATIDDTGTVSCVLDEDVNGLRKTLEELREGRLLPFDDDVVSSIQLDRAELRMVLTKSDDRWTYEAFKAGKSQLKGEARSEAVGEWLAALRTTTAERWQDGSLGAVGAADLISLGVARGKDKPRYEVRIQASQHSLLAQRAGEPQLAIFPGSALAHLSPTAARFRALQLITLPEDSLRDLEIRRDAQLERLVRSKDGKTYEIAAPIHAEADPARVAALTRMLSSLQAVRFVSDAPAEVHGLAEPLLSVAISHEDASKNSSRQHITVRIGAITDGGHYAQLEGQPGVFVLAPQLGELLAEPLISRSALAVSRDRISSVDLERGGRRIHIERRGQDFTATDEAAPAGAIVDAIATLRASSVEAYGTPPPVQGLQKPYAQITVTWQADGAVQRQTIALGAEAKGSRYARGDRYPVTFLLSKSVLEPLLTAFEAPKSRE
jgi:hypothetical protein